MWRALWQYNRWYAAHQIYDSWPQRLASLARLFTPELWLLWPLVALSAYVVYRRHRAYSVLAASVWLMIWLGGHYRYQQIVWMPVLCLGAGLAIQRLQRALPIALSALALLLLYELPHYGVPLDQLSADVHKTPNYAESRNLAATLHEPFYVWGQSPELYFESHQRPVTGVIWYYPLVEGPLTNELTQQTLRELRANPPPTVIVARWQVDENQSQPVGQWIDQNYTAVSNYWMFVVCRRKGGSKTSAPGRQITPEQRDDMKAILAPHAGSRVTTVSNVGDEESIGFGTQLDSVLRDAGWETNVRVAEPSGVMPSVFLRVPVSDIPRDRQQEFSSSATNAHLELSDLPGKDVALVKALAVLGMDCPLQAVDSLKDGVELRIGSQP
jgi:hypothetical protein